MKNITQKGFVVPLLITIIVLLVVGGGFYIYKNKKAEAPIVVGENENNLEILGNKEDLVSFSVNPGDTVSGVLNLEGSVKGGYFFEGNILVKLLDANQNVLKEGYGTSTSDWMTTEPVSFISSIDATGLNGSGYILIQNDDPSNGEGGPAKQILISVIFENKEVKKEEPNKKVETTYSNIYKENQFKKITREKYSFYAPSEWIESSSVLTDSGKYTGCELYSINYGGDGHRMGGAVNIYLNSCFNPSTMGLGDLIKENIIKDGYYIFAQYNDDSTTSEQLKTKEVYKKVIETFALNQEIMVVKLYFANTIFNPEMLDCRLVYPVNRFIPYTQAVATTALNELIKGPSKEDQAKGYVRTIPEKTKIKSIKIENGIAYVDFNKEVETGGGSCGQTLAVNSIVNTLKQFPTVKSVQLSVEGNSNQSEIFQP